MLLKKMKPLLEVKTFSGDSIGTTGRGEEYGENICLDLIK